MTFFPIGIIPNFINEGNEFTSAEQALMAGKAVLFKDWNSFKLIMNSKNPAHIKQLGRRVKGFVESVWMSKREEMLLNILRAKFNQGS